MTARAAMTTLAMVEGTSSQTSSMPCDRQQQKREEYLVRLAMLTAKTIDDSDKDLDCQRIGDTHR
eukprot:scaffold46368_cov39-Prasinocladus_malaysianus.AAC.1